MTTGQVDLAILGKPIREIEPYIQGLGDVAAVSEIGRAERTGANRKGVLDAVQVRVQQLIADGPGLAPELAQQVKQDIFDAVGNTDPGAVMGGQVETNRPPNVAMWFRDPLGPYMPRIVASGTVADCKAGGALDYCPDCGRRDCGVFYDGKRAKLMTTGNPNDCPARQDEAHRLAWARCPICSKPIYDPGAPKRADELEEGELQLNFNTSPSTRVQAQTRIHMLAFHSNEAPRYGVIATAEEGRQLNPPPLPGESTPQSALPPEQAPPAQ